MATPAPKVAGPKPSFASVVARAPPPRSGPVITCREDDGLMQPSSPSTARLPKPPMSDTHSASQLQRELQISMAQLDVKDSPPASNTLNEQAKSNIKRAGLRLDDEQTHVSSSSTKAASLDGKSTTSGTTFALDEKESLRPDDSASVQAVDDDDFGSGPASGVFNSRMGSEAGSRAFRDQFYEVSDNNPSGAPRSHPLSRRLIADIEEESPQITHASNDPTLAAPIMPLSDNPALVRPSIDIQHREPDEKLFEALVSPKDRMFLLRLEQDIIEFVKNSTEPTLVLPPCNSFCRLLAHKLADYYALTHFVDNAVAAVTLYRTPYCRIPTPLSILAKNHGLASSAAPPSIQPAMKIMRRPGLGKDGQASNSGVATTESSVAPSKAGSENGEECQHGTGAVSPTESTLAKDKAAMTRAEREARYKEKREELFGPQSEDADNEAVNEASRSSSRNEEKKRKKKHKNNDDGFEARSQFNAYYPTIQYAVNQFDQTVNPAAYLNPYSVQPANSPQQSQANFMTPGMLQPTIQSPFQNIVPAQSFQPTLNQMSMMGGCNPQAQFQGYDQQTPTQFFSVMQPPVPMSQQPSSIISPSIGGGAQLSRPQSQMSDQQQWSQNGYSYPYQQQPREQHQQQSFPQGVPSLPYQFGQLPCQAPARSGKLQHPLPGSYTRQQNLNPQTRAFIPNGSPGNPRTPPHCKSSGTSSNRSPPMHLPNGGQFAQAPTYVQMPASNQNIKQEPKSRSTRKSSAQTNGTHSPLPSSLSKWGTPATLPPKPPPPETPSMPDSLPMNNQFSANIQPMSGGQPMPHYQNGVYSMPGADHQ
ncbi:MAG: hypothetical protein Q9217_000367 [Psora testacea]